MRIVVTGATGNVGTSVLDSLAADPAVESIVAVARRYPQRSWPRTEFVSADITRDALAAIFRGADAVVHLAWLIQPGRDERLTHRVNVEGSDRVFRAVVEAGVPALVHASSVGAYSPGPKTASVDERWPTGGIESSFYSRHKAAVERLLDRLEAEQPQLRVVRMRPGLIFKAPAATEIRRLFAGPFLPGRIVPPVLHRFVPNVLGLRFQVVHSDDVGDAYRRAATGDVRGAFNLAADPPLGPSELAAVFGARTLSLSPALLRSAASAAYALRLQPTEPGWLDMALGVPIMDTARARTELEWTPQRDAVSTLRELIDGLARGSDDQTPPLAAATSGPARLRELLTRVGARP